jgi:hypothetical protein
MWVVFGWALNWIFRSIVVKFVILTAVFAFISFIVPIAIGYLGNFLSTSSLTSAFSSIPPGVWYFLDVFRIDFGAPLVISAFVASFLIRRLPVIG